MSSKGQENSNNHNSEQHNTQNLKDFKFQISLSTAPKEQGVSISPSNDFFCKEGVKARKDWLLKERLRTLIRQQGLSEIEFYHSLNFSRQHWYELSWGLFKTPFDTKLKIAAALKTDTSIIWPIQNKIDALSYDSDRTKLLTCPLMPENGKRTNKDVASEEQNPQETKESSLRVDRGMLGRDATGRSPKEEIGPSNQEIKGDGENGQNN